jgi:replicative DNA helicase
MIILDYLQLADTANDKKGRNREQEIAAASRSAKLIAKELNVPVILLSQLSRAVEGRADKMPMLSDLRESGAIEQDADIVGFIYRPAYYGTKEIEIQGIGSNVSTAGLGFISVAKQRDGATGSVLFRHNPSMTKINDYRSGHTSTPEPTADEGPF